MKFDDEKLPEPDLTPSPRVIFNRLLALESKFGKLHGDVANFTEEVEEEVTSLKSQIADIKEEVSGVRDDIRKNHETDNLLHQGNCRALDRIETLLVAQIGKPKP